MRNTILPPLNAIRAFDILQNVINRLQPEDSVVTLMTPPSLTSNWLLPRINRLSETHPEIGMRILATRQMLDFRLERIDLSVWQLEGEVDEAFNGTLLFRQDVVAVCTPSILSGKPLPLSYSDFMDMTVLHGQHQLWPLYVSEHFGEALPLPRRAMRFGLSSLSIDAAIAGQGIALASWFKVQDRIDGGTLVQPFETVLKAPKHVHLLSMKARTLTPAARKVRAWLLDEAAAQMRKPSRGGRHLIGS